MTPELRDILESYNVPINKAESVALAMGYLISKGVNGKTIYSAGDTFREVEDAISETEPVWLGEENSKYFKSAQKANYFASKSGL